MKLSDRMRHVFTPIVIGFLLILIPQGGAATPDNQSAAEKWFVISVYGKVVATLGMTKKPSGKSAAPVLFEFRSVTNEDGANEKITYRVYCKDNPPYYSAVEGVRIQRKEGGKEARVSFRVVREKRYGQNQIRLKIKRHADNRATDYSLNDDGRHGPVPEWVLMHLVSALPFDKSKVLEFNLLETPHMTLRGGRSLIYKGVVGKNKLHIFALMRDGREQKQFQLDGQHRLVRVVNGNEVFDAVSKAEALRLYDQASAGPSNSHTNRWYRFSIDGVRAGYAHAGIVPGAIPPGFSDYSFNFHTKWGEIRQQTSANGKHGVTWKIQSHGNGKEVATFTAESETPQGAASPGRLKAVHAGKEIFLDLPLNTYTDYDLFAAVERLPFRKGPVLQFNLLEASELNLKKDHVITYIGTDKSKIAGKAGLHHFIESGKGSEPAHYWVNDRHELVRVLWDNSKEFLLVTEAEAGRG